MINRKVLRVREYFSRVDVGKWLRLFRGLAILIAALLIVSYVTSYVVNEKIKIVYELEGFERLSPTIPDFESIVAARGIQFGITFALITIVMLLIAMFKGESLNLVRLLTLVAHSFIIVALFMVLQIPFIWQVPKVSYMIVDASFENITFREATLVGVAPEGSMNITSPIIRASYARVYRAYSNMTLPDWSIIEPGKIREVIKDTRTYMNLTGVRWLSGREELTSEKLDFCVGDWAAVEYQDMLSRFSVREQEAGFSEMMMSILSMLSSVGLAIYNSIGFKGIYKASTKLTVIVGVLLLLVLFFFGGI
ncbi:MAG: hypothetical protein QW624_03845 [Nitrososphaerota archaeon]